MYSSDSNPDKKLFLLDAFALIYRSYYAFIKNPRYTSTGINASAMLGFTNTLLNVLEKEKPSHIAVVFDPIGKTFRHEMFKEYKAQRPPMPDDLKSSIPYIKRIIKGFNIPEIEVAGYEADDVIGTLAKKAEKQGFTVYMMTPDKDYAQLVSENIFMYKPGRSGNETEVLGVPEILSKFGLENPLQMIDYLGLMGDSADNIPGCPGIGPKTAQKLLAAYKSIDGLYENTDKLKGKQKENVINSEEQVRFSRVLATIVLDVPIDYVDEKFKLIDIDEEVLGGVFLELEFFSLREKVLSNANSKSIDNIDKSASDSSKSVGNSTIEEKEVVLRELKDLKAQFFVLDNAAVRADLRADLCVQKSFSFRTILSEVDPNQSEILGLAFAFKNNRSFFVPFPQDPAEAKKVAQEFRFIFEDEKILKIAHDIKRDILALRWCGVELKGAIFDTMIAHYLIQPELKHDLANIAESSIHYKMMEEEKPEKKKVAQFEFDVGARAN